MNQDEKNKLIALSMVATYLWIDLAKCCQKMSEIASGTIAQDYFDAEWLRQIELIETQKQIKRYEEIAKMLKQ